ncbi:phosphatase-like protein (PTPLA), putative [Talaromyces stipitatus ATCC 10500]|uniref:Very-long-chain (3R)-3-hydroxyacyl-CoA dehydratase n=1 Tax=Talaromyces stipitatus (strain ATCC 10500 / CBS 375.48 / QM 6759 / NRRL 1006) TaxID=441959 RepID=B8ML88_TALSN|nr:phosphatase-like protein (PTPLA), putative [Talaromyces stipitatus ATCC 10500]EED15003.1 phosphatase-like protein (PTPLA), putative [Talaromyces stipitatus ATCC 10500]
MPPKKSTAGKKPVSGLTRTYLFLYNLLNFTLWATCTVRTALRLFEKQQQNDLQNVSSIPTEIFPLLVVTQSLAALEILHSLLGIVRAPLITTAMQVASRFVVVWGIMYTFREGSELYDSVLSKYFSDIPFVQQAVSDGLMGVSGKLQYGDLAFFGCMFAWGITECIRYGFFVLQLGGLPVPGWWQWLRYNTFFVLYPIGIASECVFMYISLGHAERYVHKYYKWFLVIVMGIYVPGSYILYTHMMAQRRRVMRGKTRVD